MNGSREHLETFRRAVVQPLERLARQMKVHILVEGMCVCAALLVGAAIAQFVIDRLLVLGVGPRAAIMGAIAGLAGYQVFRRIIRPLGVRIDVNDVAAVLERKRPEYGDRLVTAVAFATEASINPLRNSPALVGAVIDDSIRRFSNLTTADILRRDRYLKRVGLGGAAVMALLLTAVITPSLARIYFERNWLLRDSAWPVSSQIVAEGFDDGRLRWPIGDELKIVATAVTGEPSGLHAEFEFASGEAIARNMDRLGERQFILDYGPLVQAMRMRFVIARLGVDERTDWYSIDAVSRPGVRGVKITVTPPEYSRQEPFELPPGSATADLLRRSTVRIEASMNKPLSTAALRFRADDRAEADAVITDGTSVATTFEPARSGTYYFDVQDLDGLDDRSPVTYTFSLLTDPPPKVRLTLPGVGELVVPSAQLPLAIDCEDNLGLRTIELTHQVKSGGGEALAATTTETLPGFVKHQQRFSASHLFPLLPLTVKPGDQLVLQVRATDNQPVEPDATPTNVVNTVSANGAVVQAAANVGESVSYTLRIVTPEELQADLGRRENEWRREFEQIIKAQEQLNRRVLDLRSTDAADTMSTDHAVRYGQEARTQRQQISRIKTVTRQFEQIYSELKVNQLATPQVRRRLEGGVISPLRGLAVDDLPRAAEMLDQLRGGMDVAVAEQVEELQVRIIRAMYAILADMLKWEGYNEAVALLRDIVRLQQDVNADTQAKLDREIEKLFGGGDETPATQPSREDVP